MVLWFVCSHGLGRRDTAIRKEMGGKRRWEYYGMDTSQGQICTSWGILSDINTQTASGRCHDDAVAFNLTLGC